MPSRKVVVGSVVAFAAIVLGVGLAAGVVYSKDGTKNSSALEIATSNPTLSSMPSSSPSVSLAPTLRPSWMPSSPPTPAPSGVPTTAMPTGTPTPAPTISPAPTQPPTPAPTSNPTRPQLPNNYNFRLKLFWREGYFWQEETFEREWCLECVYCPELTGSGFGREVGCKDKDNGQCERGDQLWLQSCDHDNTRFEIMSRDNEPGDLFRVLGTHLCLERKDGRYIALETCNRNEPLQRWLNFLPNEQPFSWEPFGQKGVGCVSNHHHPKPAEVIFVEECVVAHFWDTGFWNTF